MSFKKSFYIKSIPITFKGSNYNLALSTHSSNSILLPQLVWNTLNTNPKNLPEEVINKLLQQKFLVKEAEDELQTILDENSKTIEFNDTLYINLQPTGQCSFGCGYCGQAHRTITYSPSVQTDILNRVTNKLQLKKFKNLKIGWFGGEPLLAKNIIKTMSEKFKLLAKHFQVNYYPIIVTNGYSLNDDAIKMILDYSFKHVEITLDGSEFFHNSRRHLKNGGPTFQRILENFTKLVELAPPSLQLSVRCNVDIHNTEGVPELIKQFHQKNFAKRVKLYFAAIHSWGNEAHQRSLTQEEFAEKEIEWFMTMQEMDFAVQWIPHRKKRSCMAVSLDDELIDPYGGVYNCTEVSLVPKYESPSGNEYELSKAGDKLELSKYGRNKLGDFYSRNVIDKLPCSSCEILPICAGACPKLWKENLPPCPPIKYNLEERMLMNLTHGKTVIQKL